MACACDGKQFLPFRRFGSPTPPSPTASEDTRGVIPKFRTEVRQGEVLFNDPILLEFREPDNISRFAPLPTPSRQRWLLTPSRRRCRQKQREEFSRSLLYGRLKTVYSRAAAGSFATTVSAKNNEKNSVAPCCMAG